MSNKVYNIGIFIPNEDKLNDAIRFIECEVLGNDENIISIRKGFGCIKYEVLTDKSLYRAMVGQEGSRGYRWHKMFIYDGIEKELLDCVVYPKIVPFDFDDREWRGQDYIFNIN